MAAKELVMMLLIAGVLIVLLAVAVYDSLVSPQKTDWSKLEVDRSKQQDKATMDSNTARGCIIAEDAGETILWRCPAE